MPPKIIMIKNLPENQQMAILEELKEILFSYYIENYGKYAEKLFNSIFKMPIMEDDAIQMKSELVLESGFIFKTIDKVLKKEQSNG